MSWRSPRGVLTWLSGLIVLYLGVPLVAFVVRFANTPRRGFHVPGLFAALGVSLEGASISLLLVTLFGLPLAYVLARSKGLVASAVGLLVQVPLALPPLTSGIVLIYVVGPYTFLGRLFGGGLTDSMTGVVLAMTFVAAPFLVAVATASFRALDPGLLDVAATLGHAEVARFARVAVPSAGAGIRAAMLLAWLRAFGEYGAVVVLAYNPASLPVDTYNQFSGVGLRTTLAPTALAIVVALVVVGLSRLPSVSRASAPRVVAMGESPGARPSAPVSFRLDQRWGTFHLEVAHASSTSHLAILGPSGSGKSALLRSVAGLYGAKPGPVYYGGDLVSATPVEKRHVGYVAQGFTLYPHLNVWRHLLFARDASPALAQYWLEHLGLQGLEGRYPRELSGGQHQRVALAQVLCASPRVLLLDEPFSALDAPVRRELRRELRQLQRDTGLSTVLVTHDPEEAATLAEEIVVMAQGRVLQSGSRRDVFERPTSKEVARLLGVANLHEATVVSSVEIETLGVRLRVAPTNVAPGTRVHWRVRPEDVSLVRAEAAREAEFGQVFDATLVDVADLGTALEYEVRLRGGLELRVRGPLDSDLRVGEACRAGFSRGALVWWILESPSESENEPSY